MKPKFVIEVQPDIGSPCRFNYDGGCQIRSVGEPPDDVPLPCPPSYGRRKKDPGCPLREGPVLVRAKP